MFGGTEELKQMKIDKLKYQFETFSHMPGESVTQQLQRFVQLVNELKTYQIKYDTYDMNKKLLHTLPESWKHNVGLIKNTKDITKVKIEDMIAKVEAMAMDESTRNNSSLKIDQYRFCKTANGVKALVTDLDYQMTDGGSGNELSLVVASPAPHSSGFSSNYSSSNQGRSDSQFHHCNHSSGGSRSSLDSLNDEQKALCHAFLSSYECLLARTLTSANITGTDLEEMDPDDTEGMELKWMMANVLLRAKRWYKKRGNLNFDNESTKIGFDKSKVRCYNCNQNGHFLRECQAPRNGDRFSSNDRNSSKQPSSSSYNHNSSFKPQQLQIQDGSSQPNSSPKALMAQQDGSFDWSSHAEEYQPKALLAECYESMIENTLDKLISASEVSAVSDDNIEESPFFALMATDLPYEVQKSLCTPEYIEKVKLYAEHVEQLLERRQFEEANRKAWIAEKKVFENKITALLKDKDLLLSE